MKLLKINKNHLYDYLIDRKGQLLYEWDLLDRFFPNYKKEMEDLSEDSYYKKLFIYHFHLYNAIHSLDSLLESDSGYRIGLSLSFIKMVEREEDQCSFFHSSEYVFCKERKSPDSEFCDLHNKMYGKKLPESLSMRNYYMSFDNLDKVSTKDIRQMIDRFYFYMEHENALDLACNLLGVNLKTPLSVVHSKYRRLVWELHPDVNPDVDASKIKELNHSYHVLCDFLSS